MKCESSSSSSLAEFAVCLCDVPINGTCGVCASYHLMRVHSCRIAVTLTHGLLCDCMLEPY